MLPVINHRFKWSELIILITIWNHHWQLPFVDYNILVISIDFRSSSPSSFLQSSSSAPAAKDDILDEADTRRGEQAAHVRLGERAAALVGDFLWPGRWPWPVVVMGGRSAGTSPYVTWKDGTTEECKLNNWLVKFPKVVILDGQSTVSMMTRWRHWSHYFGEAKHPLSVRFHFLMGLWSCNVHVRGSSTWQKTKRETW